TNLDGTPGDTLNASFFFVTATGQFGVYDLDMDCSSKHLFLAIGGSGYDTRISVFDIASDGTLKQILGSPFTNLSAVGGPSYVASLIPGDRVLCSTGSLGVTTLRVDPNGALTLVEGSPY